MKNWNAPEVKELNIAETENGTFPSDYETTLLFHVIASTPDSTDKENPKDPENQLS